MNENYSEIPCNKIKNLIDPITKKVTSYRVKKYGLNAVKELIMARDFESAYTKLLGKSASLYEQKWISCKLKNMQIW